MRGEVLMPKRLLYGDVKKVIEKEGYTLVSEEYVNAGTPIVVQCDKEHDPYEVRYGNFQAGKRCPTCGTIKRNESKRLNPDKIKEMVEKAGYTLESIIEGYKGEQKRLVVKCDRGHDAYEVLYQNFRNNRRCPYCKADNNRTPIEEVIATVNVEGFDVVSGEFISRKSRMIFRCPEGHDYPATYDLFLAGKRCPKCNKSKGEVLVSRLLAELIPNVKVTEQYPVRISNKNYRYDFCIHTDKLLFIEYDGHQHFMPIDAFGGQEGFEKQKVSDSIKDKYVAGTEGVELLRIPYFYGEDKVRDSIVQFLSKHKVI
jgi:very-short-patch-repair endonuclease